MGKHQPSIKRAWATGVDCGLRWRAATGLVRRPYGPNRQFRRQLLFRDASPRLRRTLLPVVGLPHVVGIGKHNFGSPEIHDANRRSFVGAATLQEDNLCPIRVFALERFERPQSPLADGPNPEGKPRGRLNRRRRGGDRISLQLGGDIILEHLQGKILPVDTN